MSTAPAIDAVDLSRRYGMRWALARISLRLDQGQSLLLTGHNGSGKTTLLRVLAGAVPASTGRASIFGLDLAKQRFEVRQRVGLLTHANALYEDLSAQENLLVPARLLGVPQPSARVAALLAKVGLEGRAKDSVRQFSAGMRKRLSIARLLLKNPALALFDEPFGELDPGGIEQMESVIRELQQAGTTVVLATHLIEQGQSLCSRRLHLSGGRAAQA
ncbi:MAG TPA: heme ABC exporter ATP-binding protein CcmA [Myxococcaceae bacterium]|nr:heme ABC exporter ATP-binding protein CcmA [Myxococcaceae bacterium]